MKPIGFIYTTFASREEALPIVNELVEMGLASCGNILPTHTAVYRWEGELKQENEVVALLKCEINKVALLIDKLNKIHPYDMPCVVQIDAQSTPEFANWLAG